MWMAPCPIFVILGSLNLPLLVLATRLKEESSFSLVGTCKIKCQNSNIYYKSTISNFKVIQRTTQGQAKCCIRSIYMYLFYLYNGCWKHFQTYFMYVLYLIAMTVHNITFCINNYYRFWRRVHISHPTTTLHDPCWWHNFMVLWTEHCGLTWVRLPLRNLREPRLLRRLPIFLNFQSD